jgi:hypothetical protein
MDFPFDGEIPRWWFADSPLPTHLVNALHLIFPEGERFFVRAVRRHLEKIDDPLLHERARAFFGQEGRHGHEHDRFIAVLRAQGYEVDAFLSLYRKIAFGWIEGAAPPWLHLSVTAALEHFTATLAEGALGANWLGPAHPLLRDLLMWHAAEEIEHKSVAFDVLLRTDDRYAVRMAGLALGSALLFSFWNMGFVMLVAQETKRGMSLKDLAGASRRMFTHTAGMRGELLGALLDYLRPDFHPDQRDNAELARSYLERIGRLAT